VYGVYGVTSSGVCDWEQRVVENAASSSSTGCDGAWDDTIEKLGNPHTMRVSGILLRSRSVLNTTASQKTLLDRVIAVEVSIDKERGGKQ
jgi:hypothetical protein